MDKIEIKAMEFYGYHGCLPEERQKGQSFFVDAVLYLDLAAAGRSDELDDTVNYAAVFQTVQAIVEGPAVQLIEHLAEGIAAAVLQGYTAVVRAVITVHKPSAPIPGKFGDVRVCIDRWAEGQSGAV